MFRKRRMSGERQHHVTKIQASVTNESDTVFNSPSNHSSKNESMNQETQTDAHEIADLLPSTLIHSIRSRRDRIAWQRFFSAYRFRSNFPWLSESGDNDITGLTAALRHALIMYYVSDPLDLDDNDSLARSNILESELNPAQIGASEVDLVLKVAPHIAADASTADNFAYTLRWGGIRIHNAADLHEHVIRALEQYVDNREVGLSPDPL